MCRVGAEWGMRRRRFLAALGGSASLGLGGLLSYRASRTRTVSVASVETYDAAFHLDDRRHHEREVESTESLEREEARVVESAIDGGYETDDPARWLSEFRDHVEFVRHRGTPYRLSDTFPRLVVTAEPYDGDPAELSVATSERFQEAVQRHSDVRDDSFLARARTGGVVDRDPKQRLRDFFDAYDAVEIGDRHFQFTATYRDGGRPYSVTAERVTERRVREARSVTLADVEQPARSRFRAAIEDEDGPTRGLVDPSPELITKLRATNTLRADGVSYHVNAWSLDHLSLSVTATPTESGIGFKDPGRIAFAVENTGDRPVSIHGGSPRPFGNLRFRPSDGGRERYLYPLDQRRSSSMWPTTRSGHGRNDEKLGSGQREAVEYAIGGDAVGVPSGQYVVDGSIGTDRGYRDGAYPFRVVLELE